MKQTFKTASFMKWQKKSSITDLVLIQSIAEIERGLVDADLGSGLFKKRIARPGFGKRSGFRTLIATNLGNRWFFVFGFAKNEKDNIDDAELLALQKYAKYLLSLSIEEVNKLLQNKELMEITK